MASQNDSYYRAKAARQAFNKGTIMGRYSIICYETKVVRVRYTVEADNLEDAKKELSDGNTVQEEYISDVEVRDRDYSLSDLVRECER